MNLLEDDSDNDVKFTVNENYARKYDKWRQGEELQKLKDKYGSGTDSDSSTSEEEDEDGTELTEDVERNFFKTLSNLKEKNPKIYDKNIRFFEDKQNDENKKRGEKKKKDQFYSVGQYQRNILLQNEGKLCEDEEGEKPIEEMTNVEQEKALKNSLKAAIGDSESENEEDGWGALFKKRTKTKEELKTEENDYKLWLAGEKEKLKNEEDEKELKGLHDFWTDPSLDEGEQFLRDYILNKRFLEKNDKDRIPSYDEIVHDSDSSFSADEKTLEQQEQFERKYNFRFEEPDHDLIKRYPRTLEQSMRKKDERRKQHREEMKARKEAAKKKKAEELKRLKALKKKEILDRINKLKEITGNDEMGFKANDLEGDFNPSEHDKRMSELFNENYYGTCRDEERPEFPELDEELEIEKWDEWNGQAEEEQEEGLHCEDPGFNMDCDYDPNDKTARQKELINSSKRTKKRRQSKFAAAVAREKPLFDPKDKTFEKYVDEYYALDYEDLIGDLPCRFKYRKVIPNDFGLTIEEILAAPDKELNSWVSVKKIMQRRPESKELYDVQAYKQKAKNFYKKQKCLPSLYGTQEEESGADDNFSEKRKEKEQKNNSFSNGKIKSKNSDRSFKNGRFENQSRFNNEQSGFGKKQKQKNTNSSNNKSFWSQNESKSNASFKKKNNQVQHAGKGSGKGKDGNSQDLVFNISDTRLKSYGINPKKLKNKMKYGSEK